MDYEIVHKLRYSKDKGMSSVCDACGDPFGEAERCFLLECRRGDRIFRELICECCYADYEEESEQTKNNRSVATRSD